MWTIAVFNYSISDLEYTHPMFEWVVHHRTDVFMIRNWTTYFNGKWALQVFICLRLDIYHSCELIFFIALGLMFADCVEAVLTILLMQLHSGRILQTLMLLFCNGVLNMMHSTFAFTVLALVTPLSYAVANATKRIVIIGGSILILQNTVSPLNGLGMLIAVFGVLCYNKVSVLWNILCVCVREREKDLSQWSILCSVHIVSLFFFTTGSLLLIYWLTKSKIL